MANAVQATAARTTPAPYDAFDRMLLNGTWRHGSGGRGCRRPRPLYERRPGSYPAGGRARPGRGLPCRGRGAAPVAQHVTRFNGPPFSGVRPRSWRPGGKKSSNGLSVNPGAPALRRTSSGRSPHAVTLEAATFPSRVEGPILPTDIPWAMAGEEIIIGSRSRERAEKVAAELNAEMGKPLIRGMENPQAAAAADIVVLTVPYTAHLSTLKSVKAQVQAKTFIDVSVPLDPDNPRRMKMPPAGSATEEAQAYLGRRPRSSPPFKTSPRICCAITSRRSTAMCWCAATMARRRKPSSAWWRRWACPPSMLDRPRVRVWWRGSRPSSSA